VTLKLRLGRWRCRNEHCKRQIFVERLSAMAEPCAHRTCRVLELVRLFAHASGGRPGERLMARLAMPASDTTILRHLKCYAAARSTPAPVRVAGTDDWSWRKRWTYGTIIVDLEQRQIVDLLADRSADATACWFEQHREVEVICRDRCGL
jgi:transposase